MNNFLGLPAHPLLVHVPVVGIPIIAGLVVAMIARPKWRQHLAVPTAFAAVVVAVFTVLAAGAGENLEERVPRNPLVHDHAALGDQTKALMLVFAAAVVAYATLLRLQAQTQLRRFAPALLPLLVACVVLGVLATVWDVRTGHSGAKAVWHDTPQGVAHVDSD